eukprot:1143883-Pelagomonas_calceolata.AAC.3
MSSLLTQGRPRTPSKLHSSPCPLKPAHPNCEAQKKPGLLLTLPSPDLPKSKFHLQLLPTHTGPGIPAGSLKWLTIAHTIQIPSSTAKHISLHALTRAYRSRDPSRQPCVAGNSSKVAGTTSKAISMATCQPFKLANHGATSSNCTSNQRILKVSCRLAQPHTNTAILASRVSHTHARAHTHTHTCVKRASANCDRACCDACGVHDHARSATRGVASPKPMPTACRLSKEKLAPPGSEGAGTERCLPCCSVATVSKWSAGKGPGVISTEPTAFSQLDRMSRQWR